MTRIVPQTFGATLWVVIMANLGGVFNLFVYGPLLMNQVRTQQQKIRIRMTEM